MRYSWLMFMYMLKGVLVMKMSELTAGKQPVLVNVLVAEESSV